MVAKQVCPAAKVVPAVKLVLAKPIAKPAAAAQKPARRQTGEEAARLKLKQKSPGRRLPGLSALG